MADNRIVYGARCAWWDSIDKAATTPSGLPVCPFCRGALFENDDAQWWAGVAARTALVDPTYQEFIEWLRGRCFPNYDLAHASWEAEKANG